MWNVILYCGAVLAGLILFWFYEVTDAPAEKQRDRPCIDRKAKKSKAFLSVLGLSGEDFLQFQAITDRFSNLTELSIACEQAGLDRANIIVGIDFTASNEWQGRKSFGGNSLHRLVTGSTSSRHMNPYQRVINVLGQTLEPFLRAAKRGSILAYGFGDSVSTDKDTFSLATGNKVLRSFAEVLDAYKEVVPKVELSGPTSFAPIIRKAIEAVEEWEEYTILLIIADGQVNEEQPTIDAIVEASSHPISIILVGVGDGPWEMMEEFDNHLARRKFDNFQFVNYHRVTSKAKNPDLNFALHALMEIPDQYRAIRRQGYVVACESLGSKDVSDSSSATQRGSG